MKRFNTVMVAPVRSLEVGDLIAKGFLGGIVSGKVTGIVHSAYQLTDEQKAYMKQRDLDIPDNEYEPIAGPGSALVFGNFRGEGINKDQPDHMYVELDINVAVFPTSS